MSNKRFKMSDNAQNWFKLPLTVSVSIAMVGPLTYAIGGRSGFRLGILGIIIAILTNTGNGFDNLELYTYTVCNALMWAMLSNLTLHNPPSLLLGAATATILQLGIYFGTILVDRAEPSPFEPQLRGLPLGTIPFFVLALLFLQLGGNQHLFHLLFHPSSDEISYYIGAVVVILVGYFLIKPLLLSLRPGFQSLRLIYPYLRALIAPIIGFSFIYLVLILFFAGYYMCAVKLFPSHQHFHGIDSKSTFGEYLYYSVITATTVGYGDIYPESRLMRIMASVQVLLQIGWITVGFAAVIAYLTPKFSELAEAMKPKKVEAEAPKPVA